MDTETYFAVVNADAPGLRSPTSAVLVVNEVRAASMMLLDDAPQAARDICLDYPGCIPIECSPEAYVYVRRVGGEPETHLRIEGGRLELYGTEHERRAFAAGYADGLEWHLDAFRTREDALREDGWAEAIIDAMGEDYSRRRWGLPEHQDMRWDQACAAYDLGAWCGASADQEERTGTPAPCAHEAASGSTCEECGQEM